jgi:hypothetical protein
MVVSFVIEGGGNLVVQMFEDLNFGSKQIYFYKFFLKINLKFHKFQISNIFLNKNLY